MKTQVFGFGNTGLKVLESVQPTSEIEVVGWDVDEQALCQSRVNEKLWIGTDLLRGWGTRGDKTLGWQAIQSSETEIKNKIISGSIIFLVASMSGGLGLGGFPSLVRWVREKGATPIVIVSLPFQLEGNRCQNQALQVLQEIRQTHEMLFVFSSDHLTKEGWAEGERAGQKWNKVLEAMAQCLNGLIEVITKKGLIFSETEEVLKAVAAISHGTSLQGGFGWGEGKGGHAIENALAAVIASDWLREAATSAHEVLIAILGGPKLALAEVKKMTDFLKQHIGNENTHFIFNAILDENYEGKVKLIVWTAGIKKTEALEAMQPLEWQETDARDEAMQKTEATQEKEELKQEDFAFETPNRGRFEKTDATFYQGENLDIPTFLRKQIRIRQVSL